MSLVIHFSRVNFELSRNVSGVKYLTKTDKLSDRVTYLIFVTNITNADCVGTRSSKDE